MDNERILRDVKAFKLFTHEKINRLLEILVEEQKTIIELRNIVSFFKKVIISF